MRSGSRDIPAVIMAAAGTILLVLAFLVSIIETAAFDGSFYAGEYEKNNTAQYVGVKSDTLEEATEILLAYLNGEREEIDLALENGAQYYNEREKMHMTDVRDLNLNALRFMWTGFIAGGVLIACAFMLAVRKYIVWGACFWSVLGVLAAFAALGIWAAADFGAFWTRFHHVFFSNDLWLFDPASSRLIRMFEEQFFFDLVGSILAWFLGITLAGMLIAWIMYRRGRLKQVRQS